MKQNSDAFWKKPCSEMFYLGHAVSPWRLSIAIPPATSSQEHQAAREHDIYTWLLMDPNTAPWLEKGSWRIGLVFKLH